MAFLETRDDTRDLREPGLDGIVPEALFVGPGAMGLEVAQFRATSQPTPAQLRELHERRQQRRATPVLVVVTYGEKRAAIAARFGEEWVTRIGLDVTQVERLSDAALDAPDRHSADALLRAKFAQLEQPIPGLRNVGLFAMHELEHGVPARSDWNSALQAASPVLRLRGRELLERLGYTIEQLPKPASVLRAKGTRLAVAVFLERPDEIEPANERYDGLSPVSFALATADAERLDYVVVLAGTVVRVYPAKPGVGTARRGRTETFIEFDLALLDDASAGYLTLLLSSDALVPGGTFAAVLESSKRFAAELAKGLRDRVYEKVMPGLCVALFHARRLRNPSRAKLQDTLDMALLTLFRLLFVAYAEDKELLPYHSSEVYREHSLKHIAQRIADERRDQIEYGREDFYWTDISQLWKAIDKGNPAWRVPAYNGGLFSADGGSTKAARALATVSLADREFAPVLSALLLDETSEGVLGPIDFRALGVGEFGTIYEGLLEQELSVADTDLSVDESGTYVPARGGAEGHGRRHSLPVIVPEGQPYLHDKSGARKSTGAYYTKDFAVEHLLERALEPALSDHLGRLDAIYDAREAADKFFDFHVADIAMGSGHFLVAAVDHVERALSGYLAKRALPGVRDELERLRNTSLKALGEDWRGDPIEDTQLLRRQLARRCIHGVDMNPLAVELARLSLWIHTFVPGLPLSFLDATLVVGNSLVGIATFDEARELIGAEADDLFAFTAQELLASAREPIARLAKLAEATAAEVRDARRLYDKARAEARDVDELLTVLTASRVDEEIADAIEQRQLLTRLRRGDLFSDRMLRRADTSLKGLQALHFPTAFPQVFLRDRPGFDVILGNPPWEKLHVEEHEFWARHFPGFRGTNQSERERQLPRMRNAHPELVDLFQAERESAERLREVILNGPYPGMGKGHPDLYKAFCWRFWELTAKDGGHVGVVLPRAVFAAKGSEDYRATLFAEGCDVDLTTLVNRRGWVFEGVHPQYSIGLLALTKRERGGGSVVLRGPYYQLRQLEASKVSEGAEFTYRDIRSWTNTLAVPLLPDEEAAKIFATIGRHPGIMQTAERPWRLRAIQGDLNSTTGKPLMTFGRSPNKSHWPVYAGESFDLWNSDTGAYYATIEGRRAAEVLQQRRLDGHSRSNSPFSEFSLEYVKKRSSLACLHARIAFRRITRATDSRTVRPALVPPQVVLVDTAPYLLRPKGDEMDESFVLGVLSSIPLDWYARRLVETHLDFHIFESLPIPLQRPPFAARTATLAARLAVHNDDRFGDWATAVGVHLEPISPAEQDDLISELDACVAHLFSLDERQLVHIFETFHEGWDYEERLRSTLGHYRTLMQRQHTVA